MGEREGDERNEGGLEMLEPGECLEAVENLRWGLGGLGGDWWMKEGEGKNQSLLKEGEGIKENDSGVPLYLRNDLKHNWEKSYNIYGIITKNFSFFHCLCSFEKYTS